MREEKGREPGQSFTYACLDTRERERKRERELPVSRFFYPLLFSFLSLSGEKCAWKLEGKKWLLRLLRRHFIYNFWVRRTEPGTNRPLPFHNNKSVSKKKNPSPVMMYSILSPRLRCPFPLLEASWAFHILPPSPLRTFLPSSSRLFISSPFSGPFTFYLSWPVEGREGAPTMRPSCNNLPLGTNRDEEEKGGWRRKKEGENAFFVFVRPLQAR